MLRPLGRLRRRLRAYQIVEGLAVILTVTLIAAGLQCAADRLLRLPADMRAMGLTAVLAAVATAVWRKLVAPLSVAVAPKDLAVLIERRTPVLRSRLISAVEFADAPAESRGASHPSPDLVNALWRQAETDSAGISWNDILNHSRARRSGVMIALCLVLTLLAVRLAGETTGLWFRRNVLLRDEPWPQRTRLFVEGLHDGRLLCARGDDLTISAGVVNGYEAPWQVFVEYDRPGNPSGREPMLRIGRDRYQRTFERVSVSMRCRVRGGDDRTDWFAVEVVDRPAVEAIRIEVEPPKYTGLVPYAIRPGLTTVEALKGSAFTFRITTNKPLATARLVRRETPADEVMTLAGDREWIGRDRPPHSTGYGFALVDALGLTNHREPTAPTQVMAQLVADAPPRVKLRIRGVSDMVTPAAVLPAEVEFSDAYGLATAEMVQESTRAPVAPRVVPVADFVAGSRTFTRSFPWPLGPHGLAPGDRLSLYATASDYDDVSGPNIGKSTVLSLRVVSREELLQELTRREQQCRQEFEQAVRAQEDLYAGVLSVYTAVGTGVAGDEHRREFGRIERRQRQQSARVDSIRRRLEGILAEMEVNQTLAPAIRDRLGTQIVVPLGELLRAPMADAVSLLGRLARQDSPDDRRQLRDRQKATLAAMRSILANMLRYEGYQEAVSLLRDIMSLQETVRQETEKQIAQDVEKLFGPGEEKK